MKSSYSVPESSQIQGFFSRIAHRYDLLNLLLSFGMDRHWRKIAVRLSVGPQDKSLLDLGTGSGKFLEAYLSAHRFERAVGIDFCDELLEKAKKRLVGYPNIVLQKKNILETDTGAEPFDIVSSSFVLRSIADHLPDLFRKIRTLLRPGGRFVILELTRPDNPILRFFFLLYLTFYLPWMGKLVSGEGAAYQFLSKSILAFKGREEMTQLLIESGFRNVEIRQLAGGIATCFIARR